MADRSLPLLLLLLTLEAALPTNDFPRSPPSFHRHDASCGAWAARQIPTCSEGRACRGGAAALRWEVQGENQYLEAPAHTDQLRLRGGGGGQGVQDPGAGSGEGGAAPGEEPIIDEEEFDPYNHSAYAPAAQEGEDLEEEEGQMVEEQSTEAEPLTPGKAAAAASTREETSPGGQFKAWGGDVEHKPAHPSPSPARTL